MKNKLKKIRRREIDYQIQLTEKRKEQISLLSNNYHDSSHQKGLQSIIEVKQERDNVYSKIKKKNIDSHCVQEQVSNIIQTTNIMQQIKKFLIT